MPSSPEYGPRVTPGSHEADERRLPRRLAGAVHHCHGFCLGHPDVHARAWRRVPSGGPGPQARGTTQVLRLCPTEHPFACGGSGASLLCSVEVICEVQAVRSRFRGCSSHLSGHLGVYRGVSADPYRTHPSDGGPPPTHRIGQGAGHSGPPLVRVGVSEDSGSSSAGHHHSGPSELASGHSGAIRRSGGLPTDLLREWPSGLQVRLSRQLGWRPPCFGRWLTSGPLE